MEGHPFDAAKKAERKAHRKAQKKAQRDPTGRSSFNHTHSSFLFHQPAAPAAAWCVWVAAFPHPPPPLLILVLPHPPLLHLCWQGVLDLPSSVAAELTESDSEADEEKPAVSNPPLPPPYQRSSIRRRFWLMEVHVYCGCSMFLYHTGRVLRLQHASLPHWSNGY
jgi:hypothetical protein